MRRLAGVVSLLTLFLCTTRLMAEENPVNAAELVRRINANEFKIHDFDSVSIRLEYTQTRSPAFIEAQRRNLAKQVSADQISEQRFAILRPSSTGEIELTYDQNRLRFKDLAHDELLTLRVYVGENRMYHTKHFIHPQEQGGYIGEDQWFHAGSNVFMKGLPWLQVGKHGFWWKPWRDTFYRASPDDFEVLREDVCDGTSCILVGNVWSNPATTVQLYYWIGKEDGNLHGSYVRMDDGPIRQKLKTLSEGRYPTESFYSWYESMETVDQERFNKEVFDATHQASAIRPNYYYSDYREVLPGYSIPHQIRIISHALEMNSTGFIKTDSTPAEKTIKIVRVEFNKPLQDDTLVVTFDDGIDFFDGRMTPMLHCKYKKNSTAQEREEVLAKYRQTVEQSNLRKQESKRAVGKKATEFRRSSVWLNHDPMSFESDLKGKIVVLNFWDVNCVPCKNDMRMLVDWCKSNPKSDMKVIGIHCSMKPKEDIQKVVDAFDVTYPVCSDFNMPWEKMPLRGYLAQSYFAGSMPFTVVIDAEGRVADAGSLHEVFPKALRLQHELEEKLAKADEARDKS